MGTWWITLLGILWGVVLLEGVLLLGVLRQLGLLHHRLDSLRTGDEQRPGTQGLEIGTSAPEFTLRQVGGGYLSLQDFRGQPVLLTFVSPGCGPCKLLLTDLAPLIADLQERGLQTVLVSMVELADAEQLRDTFGIGAPMVVQKGMEVSEAYNISVTPYVCVIDTQGRIQARGVANKREHVEELLAVLSEGARNGQVDREYVPIIG